jgi:hypothetical protein
MRFIINIKNIMNIESLEKKVNIYNKLPDQDKIGDNYKKVKSSIHFFRKRLTILSEKVDNPEEYVDVESFNENEPILNDTAFMNIITKIEGLQKNIIENDELGVDKLVIMYLDLYKLSSQCKLYLEKKQMKQIIV